MDALSVLRDYTARGELESVRRVGDDFCFGDDYRFPYNAVTAYRCKGGGFYTLESLVFFIKHTQLKHTDYFQQARALKLQTVTFTDRKPLLDYLEGKVATSDAVDLLLAESAAAAAVESAAPTAVPAAAAPAFVEEPLVKRHKQHQEQETGGAGDCEQLIQLVRSLERPVRDRDTILLCPNKSFDSILSILNSRPREEDSSKRKLLPPPSKEPLALAAAAADKPQRPPSFLDSAAAVSGGGAAAAAAAATRRQPPTPPSAALKPVGRKIEGPPIILVPAASQTLLNTYNAKEFLEDGVYATVEAKAKSMAKKPESLLISRKIGRDPAVKYEIRDKAASLSSKDWERVVAVFVLGKEWQFKDWPFKDHVDIFNKILGVYLRFEDDSMESVKVVMQWNVKIISLSKHKRHQDRTAVLEFWDKLDAFVRARRLAIVF